MGFDMTSNAKEAIFVLLYVLQVISVASLDEMSRDLNIDALAKSPSLM